jgi:Spy/CpxP family protein refolding chaperone
MTARFKLFSITLFAAAFAMSAVAVSAQDAATPASSDKKMERSHNGRGMRGDRMMMRELRGITLSDGQKQQVKTIMETSKPNQASMDEMRTIMTARRDGTITAEQKARLETLRTEMKQKQDFIHLQIMSILTPEQKQQIETRKAEREKRMAERREMKKQQKMEKPNDQ